MTCRVSHTTIDCRNAYSLSEWWKPGWMLMADLEGNEFCILRSDAEVADRAAAQS